MTDRVHTLLDAERAFIFSCNEGRNAIPYSDERIRGILHALLFLDEINYDEWSQLFEEFLSLFNSGK